MKNRILLSVLCVLLIGGCAAQPQTPPASDDLPAPSALPEKTIPQSALMSESPISPTNLDDYLFLDDVLYFDLVLHRLNQRVVSAAIGERVGRHIKNAHHMRMREIEG